MGMDTVGIGITGLLAFQKGMATASHNITNADTEGYSRQRVDLSVGDALYTGDGYLGTGTGVSRIARVWNAFSQDNLVSVTSSNAKFEKMEYFTSKLDNIFSNEESGLSPKIQDFFVSLQSVSESPSSKTAKTQFLESSNDMAVRFNSMGNLIDGLESEVQGNVKNIVSEVNSYIEAISDLNKKIVNASQNPNRPPNDLYDQRDNLVLNLSEKINIKTIQGVKGDVSIFVGNGQPMVTENGFNSLKLIPNEYNNSILEVGITTGSGLTEMNISGMVKSGEIGAVLDFRDKLSETKSMVGRLAAWITKEVNDQHNVSITENGNFGSDIFSIPSSLAKGSSSNTGDAIIEVTLSNNINDALTPDEYSLEKTATSWSITNTRTKESYTPATTLPPPIEFEGMEISLSSGVANIGDSFLINPTKDAVTNIKSILTSTNSVATAYPITISSNNDGVSVSTGELNYAFINATLPTVDSSLSNNYSIVLDKVGGVFNIYDDATSALVATTAYDSNLSEQKVEYNAWSFTVSGNPSDGDEFFVKTQQGGRPSGDNRGIMDLASKQFSNLFLDGTETMHGAYEDIVTETGSLAHNSSINAQAQKTLLTQAQERREEVSGVNLDEEAANLIKLQQAYQASAKVIQVADKMFQILMNTI